MQEQAATVRQQLVAEQKATTALREDMEALKAQHEAVQQQALASTSGRAQSDWEERLKTVTDHLMQKVHRLSPLHPRCLSPVTAL